MRVPVGNGEPGKRGALSLDGGATWQPFASEPQSGRGGGTIALSADGSTLQGKSLAEQDAYWDRAKVDDKAGLLKP